MSWMRFWQRKRRDEDLARELESYLAHEEDEKTAAGYSREEARSAALRKLGSVTAIREEAYDMNTLKFVDTFWQDLCHGTRQLQRNPAFACSGILILALGVAATSVIFSIAYSVLLRDLPFDEPDRLVAMGSSPREMGLQSAYAGAADYFDWRRQQSVFEDMGLTRPVANFNLTGVAEPERLQGARSTASLFSTLRATPLIGRTFTDQEQLDPAMASSSAVISYGLWRRRFGGDPSIVGRKILLNGSPVEVLGVMRRDFAYPSREFELWTPLYIPAEELRDRGDYSYLCVARLKRGATLEQARAHMDVIAGNLAREYPRTNKNTRVFVEPMLTAITGSVRRALWILLAAVGVLFLVSCANLANLLLARAVKRDKEFAIRSSLGATRTRLARQLFAEAIPLTAAGALLGVISAHWLLRLLIPLLPATMPRIDEIGLNGPVLLLAAMLSIFAAFLVAPAPALQIRAHISRGPASQGGLRDLLIVAETACTVVLLVSAGLLMRSFSRVRCTDPGFRTTRVLSLRLAVNRATHGDDQGVTLYLGRLIAHVASISSVKAVGIVNRLPLGGQMQAGVIRFEGRDTRFDSDWRSVSPGYFRALSVPLLAGRMFDENDVPGRPAAGIIDERLAQQAFGRENPIGRRFRIDFPGAPWVEVVGVVAHIREEGLDRDPRPQVYWPYQQRTQDRMAMVIQSGVDPSALTNAVRRAIRDVDPDQPLYDVRPMSAVLELTLQGRWLDTVLMGIFAVIALVLASVGLYGVVSYLATQRQREFGIRVAVGATQSDVLRLALAQGLRRSGIGLVLGLALSVAVTRALSTMLYGISSGDPATYASASALLLVVVMAATVVPSWRASRVDPSIAIRQE